MSLSHMKENVQTGHYNEDLSTERSWLMLCLALGVAQAWISRYSMISDGISYLDIGDAYFRGDWAAAINAYWSPMYSWWLGLSLYLFKPSIRWEFVTVHTVNLLIYVVALFSFRFFLHSIIRELEDHAASDDRIPLPQRFLVGLGYSLFLWCSLVLIDVGWVGPDLLLAAFVFLIAGLLVDLRMQESYGKFAIFGAVSGGAYLTKAIMFPLGFVFLGILLIAGRLSKSRIYGVLLAAAIFLLVCSPFVWALSKAKGRFTFGDSGKLAYVSQVSPGAPNVHWQGEPPGSGTPRHPTRKILSDPPVFEFAGPISGTYPPWDDPSYWNEGAQVRFNLRSQVRVLIKSYFVYQKIFLTQGGLLAGVLIFLFLGGEPARKAIASQWPLLAVACVVLATYALVLVLPRYVGAFIVLLWLSIFAGVRVPRYQRVLAVARYVTLAVAATLLVSVAGHIVDTAYTNMTVGPAPSGIEQINSAEGLLRLGLRAGDQVAVIGPGETNHWARLGRFRIVAESVPATEFWMSSSQQRSSAYERLAAVGARAVVAWDPAARSLDSRWQRIGETRYYAYFFPE
jgi:hypothetical protein